ncbi:MAG: biopolymer transporter ExbD, partial [Planctomycetota bacterium]
PMIDVVFLLLIFFMVATTFSEAEKQMDLDLPSAESGEVAAPESKDIEVYVLRDGRIQIEGEVVNQDRMIEIFSRAARENPETPVTIRGDRVAQLQVVTDVMDACRVSGLRDIGISTVDK